jgi:heme/copper-type cytochrome/quinol oxidase subunit 2
MNDTWFKIKLWTKLVLIALVVLFVLVFTYNNYSSPVDVWFIKVHQMTVLELLVATFLFGVIVTLLARPVYRTLGQLAELRKKKTAAPAPPPTPTPAAKP